MQFSLKKIVIVLTLCILPMKIVGESSIVIGMSAPLSGPSGHLGTSLLEGILPTIDHINANGGIDGQPLKLIPLDDQYQPSKTVKNTIALIEDHNVDLLFSYVGTPTTLQASPLIIKYKRPLLFPITGAHIFHQGSIGNQTFHWRPNYWEETATIVDHLIQQKKKFIAVYMQKDAFGKSGLMGIEAALKKYKLSPTTVVSYHRGKAFHDDFSSDAELLLKATPDAIISVSAYEASAGIIKAVRELSDIPIATLSFSDPQGVIIKLDNHPFATKNLIYSQVMPTQLSPTDLAEFNAITNQTFNPVRYEGYKNTLLLATILRQHHPSTLINNHTRIQNKLPNISPILTTYTDKGWQEIR